MIHNISAHSGKHYLIRVVASIALFFGAIAPSFSQDSIPLLSAPDNEPPLAAADLELLIGPIALYADDLIGIVLPASTYPLQIVQASRFLDQLESDPDLKPAADWDDAVVALVNYPEVLRLMDLNIDWTWSLGEAVLSQQPDVMDAIQRFRERAYLAGNLATDNRQTVANTGGIIEIKPADPEVIYIPYYEPEQVVVVQSQPVYTYYSHAYPVYYYPYPVGYRFRSGFFFGVTSAFNIGWHNHYLNVYNYGHVRHPYYNRVFHRPYYARPGININIGLNRSSYVWAPRHHRAARPNRSTRTVVRNGEGFAQPRRQPTTRTTTNNRANRTTRSTTTQTRANATRITTQRTQTNRAATTTQQNRAARATQGAQRSNQRASQALLARARQSTSATRQPRQQASQSRAPHTFSAPRSNAPSRPQSNRSNATSGSQRQSTSQGSGSRTRSNTSRRTR